LNDIQKSYDNILNLLLENQKNTTDFCKEICEMLDENTKKIQEVRKCLKEFSEDIYKGKMAL